MSTYHGPSLQRTGAHRYSKIVRRQNYLLVNRYLVSNIVSLSPNGAAGEVLLEVLEN